MGFMQLLAMVVMALVVLVSIITGFWCGKRRQTGKSPSIDECLAGQAPVHYGRLSLPAPLARNQACLSFRIPRTVSLHDIKQVYQ